MDIIKTIRDKLNHFKSDLATLKQPKMGKSHFDNQRIFELEQKIALLQSELEYEKRNKKIQ